MGNNQGGSKKKNKQYAEAYGNNLKKVGRVSPYLNDGLSPGMQTQSAVLPSAHGPLLRGRAHNHNNLNRSSILSNNLGPAAVNRKSSLSPGNGVRKPSIHEAAHTRTRDLSENRVYSNMSGNEALNQALSRALNKDHSSANRDTDQPVQGNLASLRGSRIMPKDIDLTKSQTKKAERLPDREPRDYSMTQSYRNYTLPKENMPLNNYERRFTDKELAKLKFDFSLISKSEGELKDKLTEYLGVEEIGHTNLVQAILATLQTDSDDGSNKSGFSYDHFIFAVGILCKGEVDERLGLIYKLFDPNVQSFIPKEDFGNVYFYFFKAMMEVNFQQSPLSELKSHVSL